MNYGINSIIELYFDYKCEVDICKYGAIIKANNVDANILLEISCYFGNKKMASIAIRYGAHIFTEGLELACQYNHLGIVKLLKYKVFRWCSGFQTACKYGHLKIVKYMYKTGRCDLYKGLKFACLNFRTNVVKYLLELHIITKYKREKLLRILINPKYKEIRKLLI